MLRFLKSLPFFNIYLSEIATIYMLHRVYPFEPNKLAPNENMKISPDFLEKFILKFKSIGHEFISLDKLHEILINGESVKNKIILTLDDGYLDNYTHAYPIFKKHNVPFTIYVTTSFPEKKAILWWYVLEDLIVANDEITLSNQRRYICATIEQKIEVFMQIREIIISFERDDFLVNLNKLFENYIIDWHVKCDELAMSWSQIVELAKDNLCTIAGHTKNHFAMTKLSLDEIIDEVMDANELIRLEIGKNIEHFAYPFGGVNEVGQREFDIIRTMKFKTVTTTRHGAINFKHKNFLERLPRIMLVENSI